MIVIALSDIHGSLRFLNEQSSVAADLKAADMALISGDITNFGGQAEVDHIISELRKYNPNIFAVAGNCDPAAVDEYLKNSEINLNCNCIAHEGFALIGIGGEMSCPQHTDSGSIEQSLTVCSKHVYDQVPENAKVIFVSHYPPYGTAVDAVGGGQHAGSGAILDFILQYQPMLAVTGHIHDAVGVDTLGKTTLINPGSFKQGSYAVISIADKIENIEIKRA
jgi:hypothetical protein